MNLNNQEINDLFSQVIQDISEEVNEQYLQNLESEINKLRSEIDDRFAKISTIESKIDKCKKIIQWLSEHDDNPEMRIVVESWKQFLESKKSDIKPDKLIKKKGRLNNKLKQLKSVYKMTQAV